MGWNSGGSPAQNNTPAPPPSNDYSAETTAQTTKAPAAPSPLLDLNTTDPAALEIVRKRVAQARAARGRSSLIIPLSPTATGSGGIAIPT